jgi:hypothetical protein
MTLVQSYCCKGCDFRFGPIGVVPYVRDRPQVFRYCRDCQQAQSLIVQPGAEPLACVRCGSTRLDDVQGQCPVCGSRDVTWENSA